MRAVRDNCARGRQGAPGEERRPGLSEYGIEIADVRIKRINLPEQNKQSVFDRMRAERQRDAKRYRAEGEKEALKIRAEADKEKETILSEAYREAGRIKGEGEATATRIYADAYNRDPEFYKLTRTLEAYEKVFEKDTTALLSSDSELLRIMTRGPQAAQAGR
jgi:membrane protease subunit HflC